MSSRFFPAPTGDNGWEEYLRAADIVSTKEADRLVNYKFYLEPRNNGSLQGDRAALDALRTACDLVREGNRKKLVPFEMPDDQDVNIMVSKGRSNLAKLFAMEVRVRTASGRPDSAAESVIDAMTYGNRLGKTLIDVFGASAINAIFFWSLEEMLSKLSREGARRLAEYFDGMAASPSPFLTAMQIDFDEIIRNPEKHLAEISVETEYWSPPVEMTVLSAEQRLRYATLVSEEFSRLKDDIVQIFAKEERFWKIDLIRNDKILEHALIPDLNKNIPSIADRVRTQFRLAALHCRIMEFKRTHNRFPANLDELVLGAASYDPASGGPFFYARLTDQSYTLYSLGTPETGRIDLRWRPPNLPN
jgi:hypothetical protein